ncbi:MAG: DUF2141 domain-containing protein [Bacteroidetes bacterium]|nr:DUF2141 domain-containing protein [Bacteroidota bacterium]
MKLQLTTFGLLLGLPVLWSFNKKVSKGNLVVEISNIHKAEGQMFIAVFNQEDGFPEDTSKMFKKVMLPVTSKNFSHTFWQIPFGTYSISVFHDVNSNTELDKNFFGVPEEPFGFSTNYKPIISAPDFDDCDFRFASATETHSIKLID